MEQLQTSRPLTDRIGGANEGNSEMAKAEISAEHQRDWVARRTPWKECSIEQKLEKLRIHAQELERTFGYVARDASTARRLAQRHQHAQNGEVLKSADERIHDAEAACGQVSALA